MDRYRLFDQVRGWAIIAMVMANSAPVLAENIEVGFWFRLLSSFPAPTFVIVAGAMVAFTSTKHNFFYFLQRGLFVVLMGALVDVLANKIVPFQGFDVLYLIGIMTPLAFLLCRLRSLHLFGLLVLLFLLSFGAQNMLGYQPLPLMTDLFSEGAPLENSPVVWRHWLLDGWFPLLPWLPLGFSGILFARRLERQLKQGKSGFARSAFVLSMGALTGLGVFLSILDQSPYLVRHGYVELFYPPTLGFVVSAVGVVGLLLALAEFITARTSFMGFQLLGSMTLAMYALHLLVIGHVISYFFYPIVVDLGTFYLIFLGHLVFLLLSARLIKFARENYLGMPIMLKWLVGK